MPILISNGNPSLLQTNKILNKDVFTIAIEAIADLNVWVHLIYFINLLNEIVFVHRNLFTWLVLIKHYVDLMVEDHVAPRSTIR